MNEIIQKKASLSITNKGGVSIRLFCIPLLFIYIISLFTFVNNPDLVIISRALFLLFVTFSTIQIMKQRKFYFDKIMLSIILFLLFCVISYFWAIDPSDVLRKVVLLTQMTILSFLISQILLSIKQINLILMGIAISGIILFIYGVGIYGFEHIYQSILTGERLGQEISQENIMGRLASISIIVLFVYGIEKKNLLYFGLMLMPFMMVLASGSRSAVIILVLGMAITIFAKVGLRKSYKLLLLIPVISVALYYLLQLSIFNPISLRFLDLSSSLSGSGGDANMRINMIKWGLEWFFDRPIWGYGIGNYGDLLMRKISWETYSHNNFIELLVGVGVIGFILYYTVYIYIFYSLFRLIKKRDPHAIILFAVFFTWFAAETAAVNYTSRMTYVLIGICIAFIRLKKYSSTNLTSS
ncbi:O-antigen ligase [Peribacillus deserti]|uniref:O-antigen ligase n=1 Tax=Peribacillus deserti TaxID=673318 RepID=A0ABS2QC99_9BACI|nr:O-antigen ligase family protein [Peribacillus deserti]MBM7690781.1 O-antigen ligase [Peribacillus deserti]